MKPIAILGEGAWGTAIASVLAHNGYPVRLWCHDASIATQITRDHCNDRYMPMQPIHQLIIATPSLQEAVTDAAHIFISTPVEFFRQIVMQSRPWVQPSQPLVVLSKGIENETCALPAQIIAQVLGASTPCAVVAGPSFAKEVMTKQLTGVSVAAVDQQLAKAVAGLLECHYIRPFLTDDVIGVQCGGAFKNVMAVMIGIAEGAGFSDNTKALLLTRGWRDVLALSAVLGARSETLSGLAGIGDLFLTLTGRYSKNLDVGHRLGQGVPLHTIIEQTGYIPEGVNTIKAVRQFLARQEMSLPLLEHLFAVVFEEAPAAFLVQAIVPSVDY